MIQIAVFASGSGSNAERIIQHFEGQEDVEFIVLSNKANAFVLERAKRMSVETAVFDKSELYEKDTVLNFLKAKGVDLIVLAGFLWLIPRKMVEAFPQKIINIHPSLLPKYGGKGMYGKRVHEAVITNQENESGITVHYVNEHYDKGDVILQASTSLSPSDTAATLAQKIQVLEHRHFPLVIEKLVYEVRQQRASMA